MKITLGLIVALILTLSACIALKPVHRLIDQKDEFMWTGSEGSKNFLLKIDNADGHWFNGKIIIDLRDTLYLKGFEKGSNHPTFVRKSANDSTNITSLGLIFIWTSGYTADSIKIDNKHDTLSQLPLELKLLKTPKTK